MSERTDQGKNEALAVLLGWKYEPPATLEAERGMGDEWYRMCAGGCPLEVQSDCPDFLNDWSRFPELQAYVRGMTSDDQLQIYEQASLLLTAGGATDVRGSVSLFHITPRILGEAILECQP